MADARIETVERALQTLRDSFQADGFDLIVESFEEGAVSVVVVAGPGACIECLIPQEHVKLRIEDRLKGLARVVRLRYPENTQSSH
jgi:Fe-S cluster biogenesis protein NfuA